VIKYLSGEGEVKYLSGKKLLFFIPKVMVEHLTNILIQKKRSTRKKIRTKPRTLSRGNKFEIGHAQPISNILHLDKVG